LLDASQPFSKLLAGEAVLHVGLPGVQVEGELYDGAKALLARAQLMLRPLALRDVSNQRQKPSPSLLERPDPNFYGERGAVFAAMMAFERNCFSCEPVLRESRRRRLVKIRVEKAPMLADQFFPRIAKALAALAIDV
jgi:hypothetical protein